MSASATPSASLPPLGPDALGPNALGPGALDSGAEPSRAVLPCLFLIALVAAAFAPMALQQRWQGDDWQHVFGAGLTPVLPLSDALRLGGSGALSPARMLSGAYLGYFGHLLGEGIGHLWIVAWHALSVCLAFLLLRRLRLPEPTALLAAAWFAVSPWMTQSIYWWVAAGVTLEAAMILTSALLYLNYSDRRLAGKGVAWVSLLMSLFLQFSSRSIYESFLAGPVLFLGMELVRARGDGLGWRGAALRAVRLSWPTLLPYLAWVIWFKLAPTNNPARQPQTNPLALLRPLVSVYARAVQWPTLVHWRDVVPSGVGTLLTPAGLAAGLALLVATALLLRSRARLLGAQARSIFTPGSLAGVGGVVGGLLLAFAIYSAARLAFVAHGGIALHTRHHYGGSLGIALGLAVAVTALAPRLGTTGRRLLAGACAASVLLLALACAGIGRHHALTTQAERQTFAAVQADLPSFAPDAVVVVLDGPPVHGELGFFEEWDGVWLEMILRQTRPGVQAYAVRQYSLDRDRDVISFRALWRGTWGPPLYLHRYVNLDGDRGDGLFLRREFPLSRVVLYRWTPAGVVRVDPASVPQ